MRKVAIIRRNGLGDLILTIPLLIYIKKKERDVKITLIVDQRNAPLIPYLPKIFDQLSIFPGKGNKYINALWTGLKLRKEKFDLAISAKTSPMMLMNFFLFFLGAKKRCAYVEKKDFSSLSINLPKLFEAEKECRRHQAIKALRLVSETETVEQEFYPKLKLPEHVIKPQIREAPFYIVVTASTTHKSNQIDIHRYSEVLNRLGRKFSFCVLLIAEKKDEARAKALAKKINTPYHLIFPRNFDEFMLWLSFGNIYFVPDGGIAHIGAGFGRKGVVLFGNVNPEQWAPLSKEIECLYDPVHVNNICMNKIFEALFLKCQEVMNGRNEI